MTTAANLLLEQFGDLLATPQDVERLNQAILDLAIRGKLTEQDPNDEPANELLMRIKVEKKQANGSSLPSIGEDEKPFDLPKSWEWTRLGEITNYGSSAKRNVKEVDDSTWVLDLEDIEKVTSKLIQKIRFSERRFQSEKNSFQRGDVIYGKLRPYLDKVIVADEDGVCSSELVPIKGYGGIDSYYLRLALKRPDFVQYVNTKTYGVKMPRLGTQDARMALMPLPPLGEQRRIVARVEQLFAQARRLAELLAIAQDDLTHLNESALAHLVAAETPEEFEHQWHFVAEQFRLLSNDPAHIAPLRQTILELAVRGKLTRQDASDEPASELLKRIQAEKARLMEEGKLPKSEKLAPISEDEKPFALPEGWEWITLSGLSWDAGYGTSEKCDYEAEGFPVLRIPNIINGNIDLSDLKYAIKSDKLNQKDALEPNDLLIVRTNGSKELIGRFGLVRKPLDKPHFFASYVIRYRIVQTADIARWISILGNAPVIREQMVQIAATTAGQYNVSIDRLRKVFFPLPPAPEQQRIVAKVEQLLAQCDTVEAKLHAAQVDRERLVQSVMAGIAAG